MKIFKGKKSIVYVLVGFVVLQAAVLGYSMVGKDLFGIYTSSETQTESSTPNTEISSQTVQTANIAIIEENDTTTNTEISQEILDLIKQSAPDNFERNISNYKDMLTRLDVHTSFKEEIERLIKNGNPIKDILIAYEFLYDSYGTKAELENMVADKKTGKSWADIFKDFNLKNPKFEPSKFKTEILESLINNQELTKDDIMIADRVSKRVLIEFNQVIQLKLETKKWKEVNASLGILNSQQKLPYVSAKPEQIEKYSALGISQEKIALSLIMAKKLNVENDIIAEMVKNGMSNEEIYSYCLESKY